MPHIFFSGPSGLLRCVHICVYSVSYFCSQVLNLRPATERFVRKVGRPRFEWASCLAKVAYTIVGANGNLSAAVQDAAGWRQHDHHYTHNM